MEVKQTIHVSISIIIEHNQKRQYMFLHLTGTYISDLKIL